MARIAQKHQDKLIELKKSVEDSCQYFQENNKRFNRFMKMVFKSCLTDADRAKLKDLNKPEIEFNILEAYISRLRGEFAKQEPGISVRAADGIPANKLTPDFIQMLDVLEAHLRQIFFDAQNDALEYNIYSDTLGGGFSVVHVYTEYLNSMSFNQGIFTERVFDPTMCGFDPLARDSHKGDGKYCFQLFPRTKEEFEAEYGEEKASSIKFSPSSDLGGFKWSYKNGRQEIVLIAQYYEKVSKRVKIVKLSNGNVAIKNNYLEAVKAWEEQGVLMVPPAIVSERWTEIETIVRYDFCESEILDYVETPYKFLPLVFIDGNSVMIRDSEGGATQQMTRPYVYNAEGIQRLKNFSGQTIGAEIEGMVMHKFMAALESIPEDYLSAYKNLQHTQTLVYNAFYEGNPAQPLPPPSVIARVPTPPIVQDTFTGSDATTQAILGSYDALLGIAGNQISGVAIQQGAMQSNAAALPYLMGYIKGVNRIAQIITDLIPKFYVTPRTIPILKPDGKRSYQLINDESNPQSIFLKYDESDLQVKIEAGVNSAVQKQVALEQITRMMQASEVFAQFINSSGLETILDNMDIRGIDSLKEQAVKFMDNLQKQQAEAAQKPDPAQELIQGQLKVEEERVQVQREKNQGDQANAAGRLAIEKQNSDIKFMEAMAKIEASESDLMLKQERADDENARTAVELAISIAKENSEDRLENNEN